ncbi:MAG: response regulator [Myxococcaceae bacterium]
MSLPHLLLVDDSDAILAYEQAVLSGHYTMTLASNGREALRKLDDVRPAAVLLDLSMPDINGDEVLATIRANRAWDRMPVIIVSAEKERAEACLSKGATACLIKPIQGNDLKALVARVLDAARQRERAAGLAVLPIRVGDVVTALPVSVIRAVAPLPMTHALPMGPAYLNEMFVFEEQPVCILDLAKRLGVEHSVPRVDRKLVILDDAQLRLALCVDDIEDPEEATADQVTWRTDFRATDHGQLADALMAIINRASGPLPVVDPRAFLSREVARRLPGLVRETVAEAAP